jgi:hypothetical protein
MRLSLSLLAAGVIAVCAGSAGAQQPSVIDQLLETNKVHRVTVQNGRSTSVRYVPLTALTGAEQTAVREAELSGLSVPAGIRAAAYGAPSDRKRVVIRVVNGTSVDQIEGRILGVDGDWLIVERPNGIERIRESFVIRIFEPNADVTTPAAVSDK